MEAETQRTREYDPKAKCHSLLAYRNQTYTVSGKGAECAKYDVTRKLLQLKP
jgi:hypothetical protein